MSWEIPIHFRRSSVSFLMLGWVFGWGGCSAAKVDPLPPIPPAPPAYVKVPHPEGMDVGDLMAIFTDKEAPSPEQLKTCDADYRKLRSMTQSKDELIQGAREIVKQSPVESHWCFYAKLFQLEEQLKDATYLDERQKLVLETFLFVTPFARAFMVEYQDSRYLRWAVSRYRRLSEYIFYRRVELSPASTSELADAENPFGLQRRAREMDEPVSVLEKYGLVKTETPEPLPSAPPPLAQYPNKTMDPSPGAPPMPEPAPMPLEDPLSYADPLATGSAPPEDFAPIDPTESAVTAPLMAPPPAPATRAPAAVRRAPSKAPRRQPAPRKAPQRTSVPDAVKNTPAF